MLLAFSGVTGVGKSYYTNLLKNKLNFNRIKIYTTRERRFGEKDNDEKIFLSHSQLDDLIKDNKISYKFDLLGNTYAYSYESLHSNKNTVFELHYETIYDFKKICPYLKTIYLLPKDINKAIEMTSKRGLNNNDLSNRIEEINEHFYKINNDENLRKMFDCILVNEYTEKTENEILQIVKKWIDEEENNG